MVVSEGAEAPYLAQNMIHGCDVGLFLAGGLGAAVLDRNQVEKNSHGVVIVGLVAPEGESEALATLGHTSCVDNVAADLKLMSWSVRQAASDVVHCVRQDAEVLIKRFAKIHNDFVQTESGGIVLRTEGVASLSS